MSEQVLLKTKEMAKLLGISACTLSGKKKCGELKTFTGEGSKTLWDRDATIEARVAQGFTVGTDEEVESDQSGVFMESKLVLRMARNAANTDEHVLACDLYEKFISCFNFDEDDDATTVSQS